MQIYDNFRYRAITFPNNTKKSLKFNKIPAVAEEFASVVGICGKLSTNVPPRAIASSTDYFERRVNESHRFQCARQILSMRGVVLDFVDQVTLAAYEYDANERDDVFEKYTIYKAVDSFLLVKYEEGRKTWRQPELPGSSMRWAHCSKFAVRIRFDVGRITTRLKL